jgi:hypothetical protein
MRSKVAAFVVLFFTGSCKETPPEPPPPPPPPPQYVRTIDLTVVDTGLTDVYLRVKFLDTVQTRAFQLRRDGQPILSALGSPLDTVVLDTGLSLNHTYSYRAYRLRDTLVIDSSLSVTLATLDTTSHDFTFQTFQFGQHSSSVFNDVAIIDENNIWAVGEVYLDPYPDTLWYWPYNVARWDGTNWNFMRAMFPVACGQPGTAPIAATTVYAFGPADVWVVAGAFVARWNGSTFTLLCIPENLMAGSLTKLWGESPNSVYGVGYNGTIVHYNGTTWQRVASETMLPIKDVHGSRDPRTGEFQVLCVAEDYGTPGGSKLFLIENTVAHQVPTIGLQSYSLWTVWFVPGRHYIAAGDGLWHSGSLGGTWYRESDLPALFKTSVHGRGLADIVVGGAFWLLGHYNGSSWRTYFPVASGSFTSVATTGDLIIAVGAAGNRALIAKGRR